MLTKWIALHRNLLFRLRGGSTAAERLRLPLGGPRLVAAIVLLRLPLSLLLRLRLVCLSGATKHLSNVV